MCVYVYVYVYVYIYFSQNFSHAVPEMLLCKKGLSSKVYRDTIKTDWEMKLILTCPGEKN